MTILLEDSERDEGVMRNLPRGRLALSFPTGAKRPIGNPE